MALVIRRRREGRGRSRQRGAVILPILALGLFGCGQGPTKVIGAHQDREPCEVGAAPDALSSDGFYAQHADAEGIPVLAASEVDPEAVGVACRIAVGMLVARPDVRDAMIENGARVAIIDTAQSIRDLPGFETLGTEWQDTRGSGAALDRPWVGAAEENLLCLVDDIHQGESIMTHSFGHALRNLGIVPLEPGYDTRLGAAYDAALAEGKWTDTYAATNRGQYFAEGVQSWFDANLEASPADGVHNEVNTQAELESYDPALFALLAEVLPEERPFSLCP